MKIRKMFVGVVASFALATSVSACGDWPTACEGLSASEKDVQAAADGYEVEREDSMGNTCELSRDGQTWEVDD